MKVGPLWGTAFAVALGICGSAVVPLPASAATSWAYAGGYALTDFDPNDKCGPFLEAMSASCDASRSSTDPLSGETKSGEVHVGADLASGDLFVRASSVGSIPTAESGGQAQIGDTLSFGGAISPDSTTTLRMSGTMSTSDSDSNSHASATGILDIYDDNGLITGGVACSAPDSAGCGPTNNQTEVTLVGNSFFISSTVNVDVHKKILVEFVVGASTFLTSSADISDPITITLPPGVTFTSASGLFLTGVNSVPEPSTWVMMLVGFAGLGLAGYRASRRTGGRQPAQRGGSRRQAGSDTHCRFGFGLLSYRSGNSLAYSVINEFGANQI
jgi:hypothetical protein